MRVAAAYHPEDTYGDSRRKTRSPRQRYLWIDSLCIGLHRPSPTKCGIRVGDGVVTEGLRLQGRRRALLCVLVTERDDAYTEGDTDADTEEQGLAMPDVR